MSHNVVDPQSQRRSLASVRLCSMSAVQQQPRLAEVMGILDSIRTKTIGGTEKWRGIW
jgi:hypothetical protein